GQTTLELVAISLPIAKGAQWVGVRLAKGAALAGGGEVAGLYATKAPHAAIGLGMGIPLVTHTIHSSRVAARLYRKHRDDPDAIVPQETATMITETNNVVSLITAMLGIAVVGKYMANKAKAKRDAIDLDNMKDTTLDGKSVTQLRPEDINPDGAGEMFKKISEINVDGTIVKIKPRAGQIETAQAIVKGESPHAATASGKSLSGLVAQAVIKNFYRLKGERAPATEYVTPDRANTLQILEKGGIGKAKYNRIAKEMGLELVDGDMLFEAYKKGNTRPLLDAYRQGKDLVFSKETYGHMTNTINSDPILRKVVSDNVGSVLADELHGVLTERTNYIVGDGITGGVRSYQAKKFVSKYTKLWEDIKAIEPKEVTTPKELLKTKEAAISIDPVSGRVLKNKALEKALNKKGYEGGEIDDMLTARYTPEANKAWAVDKFTEQVSGKPTEVSRVYPRGENGIMRDSIFSSKALEVGAYLREGLNPKGNIVVNNTLASATLLEALSIRKNARKAGMSGSLLAVEEMIGSGIGTKVTRINTEGASGTKEATQFKGDAGSSSRHVEAIANDAMMSLARKRGALIYDLEHASLIKEAIARKSPKTKIYEITDTTPEATILEIADKVAKDNAVVLTNKRGIQGIDYKGSMDIFANVDYLNAFELTQIKGRGARTEGTYSQANLYYTQKTATRVSDLLKTSSRFKRVDSGYRLKEAITEKLSKSGNQATASALKK
ncbi:hypothetical protein ACFL6Y_12100, partial [Elusimicrobiota bacterium]